MARVALLVTVLAAVAYISQAIPLPENVEDEQLKFKEIFDQIQPESKEILDQNQPKSEEILDQNQPKSEENLDQPDDTSKNEFEDSENKLEEILEKILKKKLEILENKKWKNEGIEKKINEIKQKIQQRTRRNSQYALIDISNDIGESVKDQFNIEDIIKKFGSLVQNTISKEIIENLDRIRPIIEKFTTLIGEKDEIREKAKKILKEKLEEIIETFKDHEENIKDRAKDFFNNALKNISKDFETLKENAEKRFENLKEQFDEKITKDILTKLKELKYFSGIAKNFLRDGFDISLKIFHDINENIQKKIVNLFLTIIEAKVNKFEDVKQKIIDKGTIIVEETKNFAKEGIKVIENKIGNLLKDFNEAKPKIEEVIEEGKDKAKEIIGNILKFQDSPLNGFRDLSKGFLSKIKRD